MRRRGLLELAGAALLAASAPLVGGCPLPQPLAEVKTVDGGVVFPPPRILVASVVPADARILVSRSCPADPRFDLQVSIDDTDTVEQVEARWFIDYAAPANVGITRIDVLPGSGDPAVTERPVPTFGYVVPPPDPANPAHVVEVVISNGFAPAGDLSVPLPNRTAAEGFETQLFRWVFEYVDSGGSCQNP